jgi:protein-disulfide isomerase
VLQTLPQIKEKYIDTGEVRYVFKDFPLRSHRNAQKAAEAARCAGAQGAYWMMHQRLFDSQSEWARQSQQQAAEIFVGYADHLGLDSGAFGKCLNSGQFAQQIAQDVGEGKRIGVAGTPTFYIHGRLFSGAYPFETFQRIIEAELEKAR